MAKHRAARRQFLEVTGPSSCGPITALIVLLSICSTRRRVWEPWHWPVVGKTPQTHFFSLIYHMPSVSRSCIIKCLSYIICLFIANDMIRLSFCEEILFDVRYFDFWNVLSERMC